MMTSLACDAGDYTTPARVVAVGDPTLRLWDLHTGRLPCRSPRQPSSAQGVAPFYREGVPHALIGTTANGLRLWRLPAQE
jgi:hypothetical protein